jgi:hypothetical protein
MSKGLPSLEQGPRPAMTYFEIYQHQPEEPEVNLDPTNSASLQEKHRAILPNSASLKKKHKDILLIICFLLGIMLTI